LTIENQPLSFLSGLVLFVVCFSVLDGYFPGLNFLSFKQQFPSPSQSTLFAHNSTVVGDVSVGDSSAIWFNAVVRGMFDSLCLSHHQFSYFSLSSGDTGSVRIGGNTMLLDNCVVIGGRGPINDLPASTHIGSYCTIGSFVVFFVYPHKVHFVLSSTIDVFLVFVFCIRS
jgi:hypothetical protein